MIGAYPPLTLRLLHEETEDVLIVVGIGIVDDIDHRLAHTLQHRLNRNRQMSIGHSLRICQDELGIESVHHTEGTTVVEHLLAAQEEITGRSLATGREAQTLAQLGEQHTESRHAGTRLYGSADGHCEQQRHA